MTLPVALNAAPAIAIQPVSDVTPSASLTDAFQSALRSAGQALYANPDAVGRTLLDGVDGFHLRETHMRDAVRNASAADGATAAAGPAQSTSVSSISAPDAAGESPSSTDAMKSAVNQSFGIAMETYSFALQAGLVNNAATTFTSSVNTLIKTQ